MTRLQSAPSGMIDALRAIGGVMAVCAATAAEPVERDAFAVVNGMRLHYVDWGGLGEPIVFVPGGCDTAFVFGDTARLLTGDHHVLGITPRGCGASDRPDTGYGMAQQVGDIAAFLDMLGLDRVTLIGHSSGAGKITQFARSHSGRVARLIYLDPVYRYVAPGLEEKTDAAIRTVVGSGPFASVAAWKRTFQLWELGAWSPAMEKEMEEQIAVGPDGRLKSRRPEPPNWHSEVTRDMEAGLYFDTRIRIPALMLFAMDTDRDRADQLDARARRDLAPLIAETEKRRRAEIRAFRSNGPHVRIVELGHTAHYCFVQKPVDVAQHILQFLSPHLTGRIQDNTVIAPMTPRTTASSARVPCVTSPPTTENANIPTFVARQTHRSPGAIAP